MRRCERERIEGGCEREGVKILCTSVRVHVCVCARVVCVCVCVCVCVRERERERERGRQKQRETETHRDREGEREREVSEVSELSEVPSFKLGAGQIRVLHASSISRSSGVLSQRLAF